MSAFAFLVLDHLVGILGSVMLILAWTAAVILGNVLFFLVGIVLFILDLLKGMTVATVLGAMVLVAIILMLALIKSGGVAAMMLEEDGSPSSRANIKTGDMELTVGEDGCPAGDAVETDAAVDDEEDEDGRLIMAPEAVHELLFLVGIVLVMSLVEGMNGTIVFFILIILDLLKGMTVATVLGAMVLVAIILMLALIKSGGVAAVMLEEDGSPSSRANIKTGDMELTVGEDGCPAGDDVDTNAAVNEEEDEDGRLITAPEAVHELLSLVGIVLVMSLVEGMNGTIVFFILIILDLLKGMTVATVLGAMVLVAIILMLALIKSGGIAAVMLEENGSPSRANIEAGDMELTVGEDGCPAGDDVETDAAVDEEEEDGRPVTAAEAVPFEPRRSPRIAAQTQTRVEPRRSRRITTNRKRADSLQNVGLQSRRSPRIAAQLMRGV
jgi:acyl-coenzyme A synthetase/AMP-(fatty) acid ligase